MSANENPNAPTKPEAKPGCAATHGSVRPDKALTLRLELERVINCASAENGSDTPDYILARYLSRCLRAFDDAVNDREAWYGRKTIDPIEMLKCNKCAKALPPLEPGESVCVSGYLCRECFQAQRKADRSE